MLEPQYLHIQLVNEKFEQRLENTTHINSYRLATLITNVLTEELNFPQN